MPKCAHPGFWGPTGVQNWILAYSPAEIVCEPLRLVVNSPDLSLPKITRQTRQLATN
jgi:hypothetical protein